MGEQFRGIPGYGGYIVSRSGRIVSIWTKKELSQFLLNGYAVVDTFHGSATETLPVHRAVALAWIENPDLKNKPFVNHIDGDKLNNWVTNLEWVSCSENNYHAIETGLRSDNVRCKIRDFLTGEISEFASITQAAESIGLKDYTQYALVRPKKFGALVLDRYEFRRDGDDEPWFYESRPNKIVPARYLVEVHYSDGRIEEISSTAALLKTHQLYGSKSKAIPELAKYGNEIYSDRKFIVHDAYEKTVMKNEQSNRESYRYNVVAVKGDSLLRFQSLSKCAAHFCVDRSSILSRLDNLDKTLDGWSFMKSLPG